MLIKVSVIGVSLLLFCEPTEMPCRACSVCQRPYRSRTDHLIKAVMLLS